MTKRAVLYARCSGDDRRSTGGANVADQLRLCRNYAVEHGYHVVAELSEDDRGASGAAFDLPELTRALDMARNHEFDILVVRELDRLSRNLAKQLIVEQELRGAKVEIEYCLYDFPDTPEGRLNKNLRAMLAEYEREKIAQRMQRGKMRKVRNGEVMINGHPPFGYGVEILEGKRVLVINEEEAETVRLIFRLYTEPEEGPLSIGMIRRYLSDRKIPSYSDLRLSGPKKVAGGYGRWSIGTISRILRNETYAGTWYYGKQKMPVEVPAIVSGEVWKLAQGRLVHNKVHSRRNTRYEYLMRGHLRCRKCGYSMVARRVAAGKTRENFYYYCSSKGHSLECSQGYISFRALDVDAITWEWVRELLSDTNRLETGFEQYRADRQEAAQPIHDRLTTVDKLIQDQEAELSRLLGLYLKGNFPEDLLLQHQSRLETTLADLRSEKARAEAMLDGDLLDEQRLADVMAFAKTIQTKLERANGDFEMRRKLIDSLQVTGSLDLEGKDKVLYLHCALGEKALSIVSRNTPVPGDLSPASGCGRHRWGRGSATAPPGFRP